MTSVRDEDVYVAIEEILNRPTWHRRAACRGQGTRVFFTGYGRNPETARAICAGCPVRAECEEAGRDLRDGIWGGRPASGQDAPVEAPLPSAGP